MLVLALPATDYVSSLSQCHTPAHVTEHWRIHLAPDTGKTRVGSLAGREDPPGQLSEPSSIDAPEENVVGLGEHL